MKQDSFQYCCVDIQRAAFSNAECFPHQAHIFEQELFPRYPKKSADSPSSIELFPTNKTSGVQNTTTIEVGLSDFHLTIITVWKSSFVKKGPRIVTYRDYSKFDPIKFRHDLKCILAKNNGECSVFENFNSLAKEVLNRHVPLKQKYLLAKDAPLGLKL